MASQSISTALFSVTTQRSLPRGAGSPHAEAGTTSAVISVTLSHRVLESGSFCTDANLVRWGDTSRCAQSAKHSHAHRRVACERATVWPPLATCGSRESVSPLANSWKGPEPRSTRSLRLAPYGTFVSPLLLALLAPCLALERRSPGRMRSRTARMAPLRGGTRRDRVF